jgi:hypothetical protein
MASVNTTTEFEFPQDGESFVIDLAKIALCFLPSMYTGILVSMEAAEERSRPGRMARK